MKFFSFLCVLFALVYAQVTPDTLAYNEVHMKNTHNSFQRNEAIEQQIVYDRIFSLEADISSSGCAGAKTGDFPINHSGDCSRSMDYWSDFLRIVNAYSSKNPVHEVITIFVDIHSSMGVSSSDLFDNIIATQLGSTLFRPQDLLNLEPSANNLQEAVANGWPSLAQLRGRVIVVITKNFDGYAPTITSANSRNAFIAKPNVAASDITADKRFVFFNQDQSKTPTCSNVHAAGFVCRSYGNEDSTKWASALSNKAHHIATNKASFLDDPWASTHSNRGYPFKPIDGTSNNGWAAQDGPYISLSVTSNDIDGTGDSFAFLARTVSAPSTTTTYSYTVFVANKNSIPLSGFSTTPKWGKSGIMIRDSTSSGARNVAILAAADDDQYQCKYGSRLSYRSTAGAGTTKTDPTDNVAIRCPYRYYQRVDYTYNPSTASSVFSVYNSPDTINWKKIGASITLSGWFQYHGVAASSRTTSLGPYMYNFDSMALNGVELSYTAFNVYGIGGATYTYSNFLQK